jgi:hypothetical protein
MFASAAAGLRHSRAPPPMYRQRSRSSNASARSSGLRIPGVTQFVNVINPVALRIKGSSEIDLANAIECGALCVVESRIGELVRSD